MQIQFFVAFNWIMLFATLLLIGLVISLYRHLLIKPSFIVLCFYHLQIQWAGTIQSSSIFSYLPNPWDFAYILHGFPLLGGLLSILTFRKDSLHAFQRISNAKFDFSIRSIFPLLCIWALILAYYLSVVPFQTTGLYAVFFDPTQSVMAREKSLKLLDSTLLKYSYTFLRSVFAPILGVVLFHKAFYSVKNKRLAPAIVHSAILIMVFLSVMLPGDRASAAFLVIAIIFSFFLIKGIPIKLNAILISAFIVLLIPVVLSLIREGKSIDLSLVFQYMGNNIFDRAFVIPMETGLWHAHYAQTNGFFGVQGINRLAQLYGQTAINVPNLIYLNYTPAPIASGLANTSYVFSYYSFFGLPSIIISVLLLIALDFVVVVYRLMSPGILVAGIAALFLSSMSFVSSNYTTVLLSGGFLVIPVTLIFLELLKEVKLSK